jgi:hypothetical protein
MELEGLSRKPKLGAIDNPATQGQRMPLKARWNHSIEVVFIFE